MGDPSLSALCGLRGEERPEPLLRIDSSEIFERTLHQVAEFYDRRKVGEVGQLGFRRSSDLSRVLTCVRTMIARGLFTPQQSLFLDMGCADGRVNVLLSYLVGKSIGIELDEWTLDDSMPLREELHALLAQRGLLLPQQNIFLYHGDSTDEFLHDRIHRETGVCFDRVDLFYTYLTMHEEFAQLIARKAKPGAVFMVYGLEKIMPRLNGFHLLTPDAPLQGIIALYQKI